MTHDTHDSSDSPPLFNPDDQGDSPMIPYLIDLECQIARRILEWVNAHPEYAYYAEYIALVTPDVLTSEFTDRLAFGLYRHLEPQTWLSWHDAPGSASSVWRHGILRAAAMMGGGL